MNWKQPGDPELAVEAIVICIAARPHSNASWQICREKDKRSDGKSPARG